MCFRPPETGVSAVICPSCSKKVRPAQGQMPKNCPFCKGSLEGAEPAPPAGGAGVVPAPGVPKMPGAPTLGAPKAPGALVAPEGPKAPGIPTGD